MRHDANLFVAEAHPIWCDCRACAPVKAAHAAARRELVECAIAGLAAFGPPVAVILLQWWAR